MLHRRCLRFIAYIAIYFAVLLGIMWWEEQARASELLLPPAKLENELVNIKSEVAPLPAKPDNKTVNKVLGWYYSPNKEHSPVQTGLLYRNLMEQYRGIWLGSPSSNWLYLTFDEGYENGYTPKILDVLKEENVPAAFFITGYYLQKNPELVQRMLAEGHLVGNHTSNHYSMPELNEAKLTAEIKSLADSYQRLTGQKIAPFLRPPMGEFSEASLWVTCSLGYSSVFWSFAYRDWETDNQRGKEYAYQQVMANHHPGAVILLHAVSKDNTEALADIIRGLKGLGYEFHPLTDFN